MLTDQDIAKLTTILRAILPGLVEKEVEVQVNERMYRFINSEARHMVRQHITKAIEDQIQVAVAVRVEEAR